MPVVSMPRGFSLQYHSARHPGSARRRWLLLALWLRIFCLHLSMEDTLFLEHLLPDKLDKEKMPPTEPFTVRGGGWLEVQTKTFLCLHPWRS